MDWTPNGITGFAAFMIADLLAFQIVFPPHTAEGTLMRVVNGLTWVFAIFLLVFALAWIFL